MTIAIKPTASGSTIEQDGSTILTVDGSGNISIANDLTVTGNVPANTGPAFSARLSANQAIADSTSTKIQFDVKEFDTNGNYDNSTNYRFTPSVEGYYLFNFAVYMDGNNTQGIHRAELYKNGGLYKRGITNADSGTTDTTAGGSVIGYANGSTDYYELYVFHTFGSTRNLYQNATLTYFQAHLARSA